MTQENTTADHSHGQKLKVLYVTNYDGAGGGAAFSVCSLMLDMKKRRSVEPVFLTCWESPFTEFCRANDIEVIVQRYKPWSTYTRRKLFNPKEIAKVLASKIFLQRRVIDRLKGKHFDIVHTNSSITDMGDVIAQHFSIPHVWHFRESGRYYYYYPKFYVRRKYARAGANIVISRSNYDFFVNVEKTCPPANTRIIYNGLEIPAPYEKKYPGKIINFCMSSNIFDPNKNQRMLLVACKKLASMTKNFCVHFIGKDKNQYADSLKEYVRSNGLESFVKFYGFRNDIQDLLKNMDVGLMLSLREAFGRVTVEYMLNYMPVIGVNTGATPEIVRDGETGFICPLNDTDKLAAIMNKFITNPEIIRGMGQKARADAVKNYPLEKNTDEIYALYQEILGR